MVWVSEKEKVSVLPGGARCSPVPSVHTGGKGQTTEVRSSKAGKISCHSNCVEEKEFLREIVALLKSKNVSLCFYNTKGN